MSLIRRRSPVQVRQWTAEPIIPPFPGASMGRTRSNPSTTSAMQSSAVWACVRLVASTVSMMTLENYTRDKAGYRHPYPLQPLLREPAADTTLLDWVYMLVSSLMLRGNAYGRIVARDWQLYPTQIELLSPDDVSVTVEKGALVYKTKGIVIPTADMWHVKAFRLPGLAMGLSPVQYAAIAINRDRAIQDFSLGYFLDAPHPTSVLTSDQSVNQEQARTIKERLMLAVQGREPLILGAGLKFAPLSVSPEESQFLATQKLGVAEIARIYGVPPEKIAAESGNSMTYANVESAGIDFLTYSIQWWLTLLESHMSKLFPGQIHVRFDPSVLLRTDIHTRLTATAIGIASHQMTPDEARAMGDLPPLTAAEKEEVGLVPMTVSPAGRPLALPGSTPAGEPAPAPTVGATP